MMLKTCLSLFADMWIGLISNVALYSSCKRACYIVKRIVAKHYFTNKIQHNIL